MTCSSTAFRRARWRGRTQLAGPFSEEALPRGTTIFEHVMLCLARTQPCADPQHNPSPFGSGVTVGRAAARDPIIIAGCKAGMWRHGRLESMWQQNGHSNLYVYVVPKVLLYSGISSSYLPSPSPLRPMRHGTRPHPPRGPRPSRRHASSIGSISMTMKGNCDGSLSKAPRRSLFFPHHTHHPLCLPPNSGLFG